MTRGVVVCMACRVVMPETAHHCGFCGGAVQHVRASGSDLQGHRVAGRYTITDLISVGGSGLIYRATDELLSRTVVVKVLRHDLVKDSVAVARFSQEVRLQASFNHPALPTVYEVGRLHSGVPFMVMAHVEGLDTRAHIAQRGPRTEAEASALAVQLLSALEYLHRRTIVHRDIKPENILISACRGGFDHPYLLDLGIAREARTRRSTLPGTTVGTPGYMAPEQICGEEVDGRADLYSLGALMYFLLTGHDAYRGQDVIARQFASSRRPIGDTNPAVSDEMVHIINTAMQVDPDDRYDEAGAMASALSWIRVDLAA